MKPRDRKLALLIAVAGVGACAAALIQFLLTIVHNNLPWSPDLSVREHYLAVGQSYTQGFAVGFFLCFFLAVGAVALGTWKRHRHSAVPAGRPVFEEPTA